MTNLKSTAAAKSNFSQLIESYAQAWTSPDGVLNRLALEQIYAPDADLIFYDAVLPQRFVGRDEMMDHGVEFFSILQSMNLKSTGDLDVREMGDDFAWTTTVISLEARTTGGKTIAFPMRQTAIWERREGNWMMVHEHVSAPIGAGTPQQAA